MNILFFYFFALVPEHGGIARVSVVLANEFEKRGHRCFYLAAAKDKWGGGGDPARQYFLPNLERRTAPENLEFYKKFLSEKQIDIVVFQGGREKFPWKKFEGHPPLIYSLHENPCDYETIVREKAEFEIERMSSLAGRIFSPILNRVVVPLKTALRRARKRKIYRENYAQCDRYVVLSPAYRASLAKHLRHGDAAGKIIAISNPCSFDAPDKISQKEKNLLWVGKIGMLQKRPDRMLEIWSRLENDFPEWSLKFLGNGYDAEKIKARAKEKKLARVHFYGFVSPEPFYATSPILCLTSSNEGFGMVLVEASAFGCVPVAFDSFPAVRDIIHDGKDGFLVEHPSADAYAERLRELMSDPARLPASAARENALRYGVKKIAQTWIALFEELRSRAARGT